MTTTPGREYDPAWAYEDWRKTRIHGTTRNTNHHRQTWHAAIRWHQNTLNKWDQLTEAEAIHQLRLGPTSTFYALFADDPRVVVDCPNDGRVTVDAQGVCDRCLHDFT